MGNRKQHRVEALRKSIEGAVIKDPNGAHKRIIGYITAFFTVLNITLVRYDNVVFEKLRHETWEIDEDEYKASFTRKCGRDKNSLKAMGDMGYSGSTFFRTADSKFLIKSLPRHFEHRFFEADLIKPYYDYMASHPDSLLVRITDYVYAPYPTLGNILKLTPSNHIIMENLQYGKQSDPEKDKWEAYDLKPLQYFYPQRDLLPSPLVTETVLKKTLNVFKDKIRITRGEYEELRRTMEEDTMFLESADTVDYSLFLIRFPASSDPRVIGRGRSRFRSGLVSTDGLWKYRFATLDFFWSKHNLRTQALTGAVDAFNVVGQRGPMTITTSVEDYRQKFLQLVDDLVEVHEDINTSDKNG